MKTMTVKDIAKAVGKPETTVRNWVRKTSAKSAQVQAKSAQAATEKKPAEYDFDETIAIIEAGLGKNAAAIFRMNAEAPVANAIPTNISDLDTQFKLAIVTLTSMVGGLDSRMSHIEKRIEERAALLPAPQKSDRAAFNQLVRDYAVKMNLNYNFVYGKIYSEMYYRLNVNVKTRAENVGVKPLDWIEANGYMTQALSIATEILR